MAQLTYAQKWNIIRYLSNPAHWQNQFDAEFFADETRKWNEISKKSGVRIAANHGKDKFLILYDKKDKDVDVHAYVRIERRGEDYLVIDESGRQLTITASGLHPEQRSVLPVAKMASTAELGLDDPKAMTMVIPGTSCVIRFFKDGTKTLFNDATGQKIEFPAPLAAKDRSLHSGAFPHVISFGSDTPRSWGIDVRDTQSATKLILARDMGLEPRLEAFNALDEDKARAYLDYLMVEEEDMTWKGPRQWRPRLIKSPTRAGVQALQKPWKDSTEFEGYFIATPKNFRIQKSEDGFDVRASVEYREWIWTHGAILNTVMENQTAPLAILGKLDQPATFLHALEQGSRTENHRGDAWHYVVFKNKEAAAYAEVIRTNLMDNMGLTAGNFLSMAYDQEHMVLAMDAKTLGKLRLAYDSTKELLAMIRDGKKDERRMMVLLDQGADLRLADPEALANNTSFDSLLEKSGNTQMLTALRRRTGGTRVFNA